VGILAIVFGFAVGGLMVAAPKGIWSHPSDTTTTRTTSTWDEAPRGATVLVLTDGPIVDRSGTVVVPAAPGNGVPKRG